VGMADSCVSRSSPGMDVSSRRTGCGRDANLHHGWTGWKPTLATKTKAWRGWGTRMILSVDCIDFVGDGLVENMGLTGDFRGFVEFNERLGAHEAPRGLRLWL